MKVSQPSSAPSKNVLVSSSDDEGGLDFGRIVAAIRRRAFLVAGVTTVVASLAQVKILMDSPTYSGGFEILTRSVTAESEVISSVPQTLSNRQQESSGAPEDKTLDATKIRVLQSPSLLTPLVEKLKLKYPEITYEAIASNLSIKTDSQGILVVSFANENPGLVTDVLNALSKEYLDYSLEERQKDIRQGMTFVENQLPQLEERVATQQERLQRFRQTYNLIDPELQAKSFSDAAGTLSQKQIETRTQLDETRLLYSEVQNELTTQPIESAASSVLSENSRYQKLLDQLLEIDSKLAQNSALYLEKSSEMRVLQEQRRNLVPLLQREAVRVQREVASRIQELQNRNLALGQSTAVVNQGIKQLSALTREYTDIQRELQIATDNLNQFLAKREGLRIDAAQRQVPWQLLTPPGPPVPGSASKKQTLILGVALGLLLGVGIALVLDRLSNVIHTPKEVKDITKLPVLGIIPFNRHLNQLESMRNAAALTLSANPSLEFEGDRLTSAPFQEAFRSLDTNLRLLSPDAPICSLVVTSPTPNNGKTTVAIHLAQAAAALGKRVLLVDTDLRRPRLHHYLGLSNDRGLTDVVSSDLELQSAIQAVPWEKNLFVLPCGSVPPDPTRILASQSMRRCMEVARESFDLVIYDVPPLLGFADTSLLSAQTDAVLLVVRLHQVKRAFLEQAVDELKFSTAPIMAAVANGSEEQSFSSYQYSQYYVGSFGQPDRSSTFKPKLTQYSRQARELWNNLGRRK